MTKATKPTKTKHTLSVAFINNSAKLKREVLNTIREAVAKAVGAERVVVKTAKE